MDSNSSPYDMYTDLLGNVDSISPSIRLGRGVTIGRNVIILDNCVIGGGTKVEHFVLLKEYTFIGNDCFIDSYVRSSGHNAIGNNVTIRFGSTICREATIEDNVFISPNVMTIYSTYEGKKAGGIVIGNGSHIGTGAVINAGVKICPGSVVGAMSLVTKDITRRGVYMGVPVRFVRSV